MIFDLGSSMDSEDIASEALRVGKMTVLECTICKKTKNFLHFVYLPDTGLFGEDVCLECVNKVPKYIPDIQKRKFLQEKVKKGGINV